MWPRGARPRPANAMVSSDESTWLARLNSQQRLSIRGEGAGSGETVAAMAPWYSHRSGSGSSGGGSSRDRILDAGRNNEEEKVRPAPGDRGSVRRHGDGVSSGRGAGGRSQPSA